VDVGEDVVLGLSFSSPYHACRSRLFGVDKPTNSQPITPIALFAQKRSMRLLTESESKMEKAISLEPTII
jgi:hypothetical protein